MILELKRLAALMGTLAALSGLSAPAAQALPSVVTSVSPVNVHATGSGTETLTIDGVTFRFKISHYTGTLTNGSNSLTLTPTYTETEFGGTELGATTTTNGCSYKFNLTEKASAIVFKSHMDIECAAGKVMVITGISIDCELTIGSQAGLTSVDFTNDASDVTFAHQISGITGTVTKDPFLCPFNGTGVKTNGTYVSHNGITLTAASGSLQITG